MQFPGQIPGSGRDQQGCCNLYFSESPLISGGLPSFSQANMPSIIHCSGNIPHCHHNHVSEHYDHRMFYEIPPPPPPPPSPYNAINGHFNHIYNPYLSPAPSSGYDQVASSSSHGVDRCRDSSKRKSSESVLTNPQYFHPSTTFGPLVSPVNSRQFDGVLVVDTISSPYYQNGRMPPLTFEMESHGSSTHPSGSAASNSMFACHGQMVHGVNSSSRPARPIGVPWFERSSTGEGRVPFCNGPILPYFHGRTGVQRPAQRTNNCRGFRNLVSHQSSATIQALPCHNPIFRPVPISEVHVSPNFSNHFGSHRSSGAGSNSLPLRRRTGLESASVFLHSLNLRHLPLDEVAILDLPDDLDNFGDHHRDMRLDIDEMSYEDLLALGERIGYVEPGLSEEAVLCRMNTRTFMSSSTYEKAAPQSDQGDMCVICQGDFVEGEVLGILGCGHEYHADCLKKWVVVKNICPICKSSALQWQSDAE